MLTKGRKELSPALREAPLAADLVTRGVTAKTAAIRDDYAPPAEYLPKAERERQWQAIATATVQKQQAEAAKRRQEEAEKTR